MNIKADNTLPEKVRAAIDDYNMLERGDAVVVALSGGADSVSLLCALTELSGELGISVSACHVNHMLRGEESDRDMRFCEELCGRLGAELSVLKTDVRARQKKHESIEECARRVRYDFFEQVSEGKKLATAHSSCDSAETVLLNLLRGTGLKGLCGIPPVRGRIIRPLIYCTRAEVEEFCRSRGQSYVTDSTNLDTDYTRNKLRHNIIPHLLEINGSFYNTVSRMEKSLREDSDFLEGMAEQALESSRTETGYLAASLAALPLPIKKRAAARILKDGGVEPSTLRIETAVTIIDAGKGRFNPCRDRFFTAKRGAVFVEFCEQHYKKHEKKM